MSPLELPGNPLGSRKSKNKAKCPRCGKEQTAEGPALKVLEGHQELKIKCNNCGHEFKHKPKKG